MFVVCKRVCNCQPSHDGERNVVDDAGIGGIAAPVGGPRLEKVGFGRNDQESLTF
jgi:hypothetical protein